MANQEQIGLKRGYETAKNARQVFQTPEGWQVLLWIMRQGRVFDGLSPYPEDQISLAIKEGRRSLAAEIAHMAGYGVEDFIKLLQEAKKEDERYDRDTSSGQQQQPVPYDGTWR